MNSAPPQTSMHPTRRVQLAIIAVGFVLFALSFGASRLIDQIKREPAAVPDEREIAAQLLEEKLGGPGYFHRTPIIVPGGGPDASRPAPHGKIRITLHDAQAQLPQVAEARKFEAEKMARVEKLFDQLSEPSGSRIAGEVTIDLLQLNLALDEIR